MAVARSAVVAAIITRTLETGDGAQVLPGMQVLLGRRPNTFAIWARAHTGAFTGRETETTTREEAGDAR